MDRLGIGWGMGLLLWMAFSLVCWYDNWKITLNLVMNERVESICCATKNFSLYSHWLRTVDVICISHVGKINWSEKINFSLKKTKQFLKSAYPFCIYRHMDRVSSCNAQQQCRHLTIFLSYHLVAILIDISLTPTTFWCYLFAIRLMLND